MQGYTIRMTALTLFVFGWFRGFYPENRELAAFYWTPLAPEIVTLRREGLDSLSV